MPETLALPEQFLLLCLNDETGKFEEDRVGIGLNGAVLLELILRERIRLDEQSRVVVQDQTPTGDPLLDRMLAVAATVRNTHPLVHWIGTDLGRPSNTQIVLNRLVDSGVLRREDDGRFLWLIRQYRHPSDNPVPERTLREELLAAITSTGPVSQRLTALIALLQVCHAMDRVLTGEQQTLYRERIAEICSRDALVQSGNRAVGHVVSAADTADFIGSTIAAVGECFRY